MAAARSAEGCRRRRLLKPANLTAHRGAVRRTAQGGSAALYRRRTLVAAVGPWRTAGLNARADARAITALRRCRGKMPPRLRSSATPGAWLGPTGYGLCGRIGGAGEGAPAPTVFVNQRARLGAPARGSPQGHGAASTRSLAARRKPAAARLRQWRGGEGPACASGVRCPARRAAGPLEDPLVAAGGRYLTRRRRRRLAASRGVWPRRCSHRRPRRPRAARPRERAAAPRRPALFCGHRQPAGRCLRRERGGALGNIVGEMPRSARAAAAW